LTRVHLDLTGHHTRAIKEVTARIEVMIEPFQVIRDMIVTIPGISTGVADVIIAETGADMTRFPTAGHLASWAGTCPGSNESAGRVKPASTRPGNPYLKGAPGIAAMPAARSRGLQAPAGLSLGRDGHTRTTSSAAPQACRRPGALTTLKSAVDRLPWSRRSQSPLWASPREHALASG
jgi:transposase